MVQLGDGVAEQQRVGSPPVRGGVGFGQVGQERAQRMEVALERLQIPVVSDRKPTNCRLTLDR